MADLKTKPTKLSPAKFISQIDDEAIRKDCRTLLKLMKETTSKTPRVWSSSIIGFGEYHYKYDSGREGDWFVTGFAPRKRDLTIYIMNGFSKYDSLMKKLGTYKTGKSCLYIKKLENIDTGVLRQLVKKSVADMNRIYECR